MMANSQGIVARVEGLGGFQSSTDAAAATTAVLRTLAGAMPRAVREQLRKELPPLLASAMAPPDDVARYGDADAFLEAVALAEGAPLGLAKEHTTIVCQVLAELMGQETLQLLHADLAPDVARLFVRRQAFPPVVHDHVDTRRTLSVGRPGGLHPLSEADGESDTSTLASGRPGGIHPLSEAPPRPGPSSEGTKS